MIAIQIASHFCPIECKMLPFYWGNIPLWSDDGNCIFKFANRLQIALLRAHDYEDWRFRMVSMANDDRIEIILVDFTKTNLISAEILFSIPHRFHKSHFYSKSVSNHRFLSVSKSKSKKDLKLCSLFSMKYENDSTIFYGPLSAVTDWSIKSYWYRFNWIRPIKGQWCDEWIMA